MKKLISTRLGTPQTRIFLQPSIQNGYQSERWTAILQGDGVGVGKTRFFRFGWFSSSTCFVFHFMALTGVHLFFNVNTISFTRWRTQIWFHPTICLSIFFFLLEVSRLKVMRSSRIHWWKQIFSGDLMEVICIQFWIYMAMNEKKGSFSCLGFRNSCNFR